MIIQLYKMKNWLRRKINATSLYSEFKIKPRLKDW